LSFVIAVAGKGGTGKTTLSGLFIRTLMKRKKGPILAVDADPNSNLPLVLGLKVDKTIGMAREEFFDSRTKIPAGMPREAVLETKLHDVLVENRDYDLLVMGRPEGPGCYCYLNNILRKFLDVLVDNYPYSVVDNEAGMEHLSRRTTKGVDILLIVSDHSLRGIETAFQIKSLAHDLNLEIKRYGLIVNRVKGSPDPSILDRVQERGLELTGIIPEDEQITGFELKGTTLMDLPDDSPAVVAVDKIVERLNLP